jgi:hypothetical protein
VQPARMEERSQPRGAMHLGASCGRLFTNLLTGGAAIFPVGRGPRIRGCRIWGITWHPAVPQQESQGSSHEEQAHQYEDSCQHLRHRPSAQPVVFGPRSGQGRALGRVPEPRSPFRKCCGRARYEVAGGVESVRQCRDTGPHGRHGAGSPTKSPRGSTAGPGARAAHVASAHGRARKVATIGAVGRGMASGSALG